MNKLDLQTYVLNLMGLITNAVKNDDREAFIENIGSLSELWNSVDETSEGDVIQEVVDDIASINYPFTTTMYEMVADFMDPSVLCGVNTFADVLEEYLEYNDIDEWGVE